MYNILNVIEKRNNELEAIEELIKAFEAKIIAFFTKIHFDELGKRVLSKINNNGTTFSLEEILQKFIERIPF